MQKRDLHGTVRRQAAHPSLLSAPTICTGAQVQFLMQSHIHTLRRWMHIPHAQVQNSGTPALPMHARYGSIGICPSLSLVIRRHLIIDVANQRYPHLGSVVAA